MKKGIYAIMFIMVAATAVLLTLLVTRLCAAPWGANTFTLRTDAGITEVMSFKASDMYPGDYKEYTLIIKSDHGGNYTMNLDFTEVEDSGKLGESLKVEMSAEGFKYTARLIDLFDGKPFKVMFKVGDRSTYELRFRYYLDLDAGNEAQGETVDFNIAVSFDLSQ